MSRRIATLKRLAGLQGNDKARADACYRLAAAYETGDCVKKYGKEQVKWLIKASKLGHVQAQYKLGLCYNFGKGVAQSDEKAFEWYQKAADQGHAWAQCNLGVCYYNGKGVAQSDEKAFEWYQKAADQGDVEAQNNLGDCHRRGKGVAQSDEKAFEWYQKAADQGHARAQNNLGLCYYHGKGVAQSNEKAFECYQKAAHQGHVEAQYNLGVCYYNAADGKNAKRFFKLAAKQGFAAAHSMLAQVEERLKEIECWQKAADQGDVEAQYNLGVCYYDGDGVAVDRKKAKRLFKLAAKQGEAAAHSMLAQLEAEPGKDANLQKAQKHIRKAQAALQADGSVESADSKRVAQAVYDQAKLASLFISRPDSRRSPSHRLQSCRD